MKFFVDTADVAAIRELNDLGMVDGVTTNPSLILKSGRDIIEVTKEICDIVDGPVSAEVVASDAEGMIREGRHLVTELGGEGLQGVVGVFDGVVQQCRGNSRRGHAQFGEDLRDRHRMGDVGLAAASTLVAMEIGSRLEGALEQVPVAARVVLAQSATYLLKLRITRAPAAPRETRKPTAPGGTCCVTGKGGHFLGHVAPPHIGRTTAAGQSTPRPLPLALTSWRPLRLIAGTSVTMRTLLAGCCARGAILGG